MDDPIEMTVSDVLDRNAEDLRREAERLREMAFRGESDAHKHRARADTLELRAVEHRTAANILRKVGLTTFRDADGVPGVKVERTLVHRSALQEDR